MSRMGIVLASALLLAGCKDEKKEAAPASGSALEGPRSAALQAVAAMAGMPKTVQFRGIQAYPQAAANHVAVCGLVTAFADDPTIFVPFVTVANQVSPPDAQPPRFEFDTHVGTTTTEASRVYLALVADCWDRGGPAPDRRMALAPLPDNVPDPHLPALPDPSPSSAPPPATPARPAGSRAPGQTAADGSVAMRQSANVHAGPGGPTVRTVPQGTALHVFAQAPGGWYQVGDTAPFGWVHESMLDRH